MQHDLDNTFLDFVHAKTPAALESFQHVRNVHYLDETQDHVVDQAYKKFFTIHPIKPLLSFQ